MVNSGTWSVAAPANNGESRNFSELRPTLHSPSQYFFREILHHDAGETFLFVISGIGLTS